MYACIYFYIQILRVNLGSGLWAVPSSQLRLAAIVAVSSVRKQKNWESATNYNSHTHTYAHMHTYTYVPRGAPY